MITLQAIRHWQQRSVRRTCAVLVAVWINLAFQACAMGAMPDDDCPHCPPGMHDSEMPMDSMAPMVPMDCGVIDSIDEPNLVGPASKSDSEVGGLELAVLGSWSATPTPHSHDIRSHRYKSVHSVHGPPLNVLYCVYLK